MVVLELMHMDVKRDHCCVKVTSSCNLACKRLPELMHKNVKFNGEHENKSIICVRIGQKNLFLWITVCHH